MNKGKFIYTNQKTGTLYPAKELSVFQQILFFILLCCIFLIPTQEKNIRLYTVLNFLVPLLLYSHESLLQNIKFVGWILLWGGIFIVSTLFRIFILPSSYDYIREFTELGRIFILIPYLLIHKKYFGVQGFKVFLFFIVCYIFSDFYLTLCETSVLPRGAFYQFVSQTYYLDAVKDHSYLAKGWSALGGIHGLIMAFCIVFLTCLVNIRFKQYLCLLLLLMCFYSLFASGSRSSMIAVAAFYLLLFAMSIIHRRKPSFILILMIVIAVFAAITLVSNGYFAKLSVLLEEGLATGSFEDRQMFWGIFLDRLFTYWYLFPIGWGKTIFFMSKDVFFTDNDYLTYILVHGVFIPTILLLIICNYILKCYKQYKVLQPVQTIRFYLLGALLVVSVANPGFSYPTILILLVMFFRFSNISINNYLTHRK